MLVSGPQLGCLCPKASLLILTRFKTDANVKFRNNDNYSFGRISSGFINTEEVRISNIHVLFVRNHFISNLALYSLKFKKLLELQGTN